MISDLTPSPIEVRFLNAGAQKFAQAHVTTPEGTYPVSNPYLLSERPGEGHLRHNCWARAFLQACLRAPTAAGVGKLP